jgi:hypothetical protein
MLFAWLRKMVRDAFLAGVQDGVHEITREESGGPEAGILLRLKLERPAALPAPVEVAADRKRKVA